MPRLHFTDRLGVNSRHSLAFADQFGNSNNDILLAIASAGHTPATFGLPVPVYGQAYVVNRFVVKLTDTFNLTLVIEDIDAAGPSIIAANTGKQLTLEWPFVVPAGWNLQLRHSGGAAGNWFFTGYMDWEQWIL